MVEYPVSSIKPVYTEKTYRGLAVGPSSTNEALTQIEEAYGGDIVSLTLEYTDDMDCIIYDDTNEEEMPWLTKKED